MSPTEPTGAGGADRATPAAGAAKKAAATRSSSTTKSAGTAKPPASGSATKAAGSATKAAGSATKAAGSAKKAAGAARAATKKATSAPRSTSVEAAPTAWLRVTQVRSAIGTKPKHRGTLTALGLRGIGRTNLLPDRPEIRGMLARVPHLVEVAPVDHDQKGRS